MGADSRWRIRLAHSSEQTLNPYRLSRRAQSIARFEDAADDGKAKFPKEFANPTPAYTDYSMPLW